MPDRSWRELKTLSTLIIASLFLSGAAFYNGYPLVYPDTGCYLDLNDNLFRSFFYNIFIFSSSWFQSLWPVALRQVFDRCTSSSSYAAGCLPGNIDNRLPGNDSSSMSAYEPAMVYRFYHAGYFYRRSDSFALPFNIL